MGRSRTSRLRPSRVDQRPQNGSLSVYNRLSNFHWSTQPPLADPFLSKLTPLQYENTLSETVSLLHGRFVH